MVIVLLVIITLCLVLVMAGLAESMAFFGSEPVQAGWRLVELWLKLQIYGAECERQVIEAETEMLGDSVSARQQLEQELAMIELLERLGVLREGSGV